MKATPIILILSGLLSIFTLFVTIGSNPSTPRAPASMPSNYESLKACEKQSFLWDKVVETTYKDLPGYRKLGLMQLIAMGVQEISLKGTLISDFSPEGWEKYLHRRGAIAKIKIEPTDHKYTGIFQGAECGLLRLSLTYKTAGSKPVAPGLALKVLRDGVYSANVSALVSLDGQGKDYNFFKNPMSNIVTVGHGIGQKLVHKLFRRVSQYPEEIMAQDMAQIDSHGEKVKDVVSPRQIFFVPQSGLRFSSEKHDVREDFMSIPEGTIIYKIYLGSDKYLDFDYSQYSAEKMTIFLKESEHVGDIVSTSQFLSSDFGDDGIFFRHQLRP